MALGLISVAAPAQASELSVDITDGITAEPGVPTGYFVIGTGLSKKTPVSINWGDGTAQVARSKCSAKKATVRPRKCRIRVGHEYTSPGTYQVTAQDKSGQVLDSATVTIVGESREASPETSKPTIQDTSLWRSSMRDRINTVRAGNGAGPVGSCPRLDQVAQSYAQVMADTGHYGHTGPGGESPWDRMRAGGYDYRAAAENIAYGYPTADRVQQAWVDSPGHFRNMVNPGLASVGLGAAESASGRWYWVQVYGSGGSCDLGGQSVETPAPLMFPMAPAM